MDESAEGRRAEAVERREELCQLPPDERSAATWRLLRSVLAALPGVDAGALDPATPLPELIPDLGTAVAVRQGLRDALAFPLYPNEIRAPATLGDLAGHLSSELGRLDLRSDARRIGGPDAEQDARWRWSLPSAQQPAQKNPSAVFVVSAPRSGSTLFRSMLAGHPELFSPPELTLLPWDSMRGRHAELERFRIEFMEFGLVQALCGALGVTEEEAAARLRSWIIEDTPVREVYTLLQGAVAPRLLVDKSPINAAHIEWMRPAERVFHEPRYVFLTRHPFAVVESFARMRFERLLGPRFGVWHPDPLVFGERSWTRWNENTLSFLAEVPAERQLRVRYEELVQAPQVTMERVCAFLDLPFDPGMLAPYQGERMLRASGGRGPTIGDPNILERQGIDPRLSRRWEEARLPLEPESRTREVATRLGYALR